MAREPAPITASAGSAANAAAGAAAGAGDQPKKKEKKQQRPTNPDSKNQKKKARKNAKKTAQASWCWYCDREFEDDRILLSHQKAKHFRCPHCPRRLNTAGGLAVHIDQVHKLPVDRLENTLPGRDSFDIEIYGMEGIPKNDLEEWKRKRNTELGLEAPVANKRPRIYKGVITIDDLAKQLAVHKSLMRQSKLRNQRGPPGQPGMQPMPMHMQMPGAPPMMGGPPPTGASPFPMPPGVPMPPPGMFPMPPNIPLPPGFGSPMPGATVPGVPAPFGAFPPPAALAPGQSPVPGMPPVPMQAQVQAAPMQPRYVPSSSRAVQKSGQVHIYADSDVSYEEKRAKNPKYAQTVTASAAPAQIPAQTQAAPTPAAIQQVQPQAPQAAAAVPAQSQADDGNPRVSGSKRARAADLI